MSWFSIRKVKSTKNDIVITKLSKNNSNKPDNEYYNIMRFRMSFESFRHFPIGFVGSIQVCQSQ